MEGIVCPYCLKNRVRLNGKKNGKQQYLCTNCGKSFRIGYERPIKPKVSGIYCPECNSDEIKRNGVRSDGIQTYQCKVCKRCFVPEYKEFKKIPCRNCRSLRTQKSGHGEDKDQRWFCLDCGKYFKEKYIIGVKWSIHHDCCIICGTTKVKHQSKGKCMDCYNREFRLLNSNYYKRWKRENHIKIQHYSHKRRVLVLSNSCSVKEYEDFVSGMTECTVCGKTTNLEVDHVVPICHGGAHQVSNFQCLCSTCNRHKGKMSNEKFLEKVKEKRWEQIIIPCKVNTLA